MPIKTPKTKKQKSKVVEQEMHRFKEGDLHSGKGGPVVKSKDQALAISLSEAGLSRTKKKRVAKKRGKPRKNKAKKKGR